jgi:group II intron reverse transcriptase/maturase
MGMERRLGSCANATEAEREQIDGLKRKVTFTNQLTWSEMQTLKEYEWETNQKQTVAASKEAKPMTKVRKLQRLLYRQAKSKPGWKAWTLYGDLCSREILADALQKVMANKGGPGVDGMRVDKLKDNKELREQFLQQLEKDLRDKTYQPQPIRRVYIPKPDGKKRPLGIPTVRDRVVQTAVVTLLSPIFEADFHENSFAYRPKRSAHQAIDAITKALLNGKYEVVDADLSSYFDTIPHAGLMQLIKKRVSDGSILRLIKGWLRANIEEEDPETGAKIITKNRCGTPQGGVVSPLLANLYLDGLDKAVNGGKKMKAVMVRFADDLVALCRNGQGAQMKQCLKQWLERHGLKLNEEKTRIVDFREESFEFLGFRLSWRKGRSGKYYPLTVPSPKSCNKIREVIRQETARSSLLKEPEHVFKRVNQQVRGWTQYFHYGNSTKVMAKMERFVESRMRGWLWNKHARTRGKYTKHYNNATLHNHYGLIKLPLYAAWKHS